MKTKFCILSEEESKVIDGGCHTGDATTCPHCKGLLPGTGAYGSPAGPAVALYTYAVMAYCWAKS